MLFRKLTLKETAEFEQAARNDFKAGDKINYDYWHPAYCAECDLINLESIRAAASGQQLEFDYSLPPFNSGIL